MKKLDMKSTMESEKGTVESPSNFKLFDNLSQSICKTFRTIYVQLLKMRKLNKLSKIEADI
jgi:hypothetical protein